ncbi:polysaccharide pyruvyl transferase family protein [Pseudomonas sp. NY15181]|uniref:polysaccharide pyruvyl transferase family protein n=1 Tax=Pseudomonas sp. NY15181 TaxID=3400349 RepID=UPI003A8C2A76
MSNLYLYADESSLSVLKNTQQKIILIGGDFGYGNFGDVLQHLNTIRLAKETERYATISVMAANSIGFPSFPQWARSAYGADAIIYIADYPLVLDENSPKLSPVGEIRNLSAVHLYGGGHLNNMWGDFVLSVASYFLRLTPGIGYFVSGQQVTTPYQEKVAQHIKEFSPTLFGVRDELSRQWLMEAGFEPHYSFDDATEALQDLAQRTRLKRGDGLLLHLNASDYTANLSLQAELSALQATTPAKEQITIFQAFRDKRQEVVDTFETIKRLDAQFPFYDARFIDLVGLIFANPADRDQPKITGQVGYSCSYHVALWLQLAGIPCWLRSSNSFYDQKSKALQVTQSLEDFIQAPKLADHGFNLERRASWRTLLLRELINHPEVNNLCLIPGNPDGPAPWPFFFKGTPTLEDRLADALRDIDWHRQCADNKADELSATKVRQEDLVREVDTLSARLNELDRASQLQFQRAETAENALVEAQFESDALAGQIGALNQQVTELGNEVHQQRTRASVAENQFAEARAENDILTGQIDALISQITEIGHHAHLQHADIKSVQTRLSSAEGTLAEIYRSRSWRLTRPLRGMTRFVRSGHFDSHGKVGIFAMTQRLARRLPIPEKIRSSIGRFLQRFRRK